MRETVTPASSFPIDISDPSLHALNGEPYAGEIGPNANILLDYVFSSGDYTTFGHTIFKAVSSFSAKNLTCNLNLPENFWAKRIFEISESRTVSVENMALNILGSAVPHPNLIIASQYESVLRVEGDFTFSDTRTKKDWYQTRLSIYGNGTVEIGENLVVKSEISNFDPHALDGINFEVQSRTFTVGGVLSLVNSNSHNSVFRVTSSSSGTFTRTLGGLQVAQKGMIQLAGNAEANVTEFVFTNSGTSEYVGGLMSLEKSGAVVANTLNIRMVASDAANGRQIMRFSATDSWTLDSSTYSDAAEALNEVEVSGGRLDIGMYDGMKGGELMIMGYNNPSEAMFSATGTAAGSEIGKVVFDSMSFHCGTVVFDMAETEGDFIQINGSATKTSGASPLVLEINVSAYDLQAWLEASGGDEWNADLMSFATGGSNVSADDFVLKLQDGVIGNITISESGGISTLAANLSLVPEPADIAAAMGALVLAFAACRRRRLP